MARAALLLLALAPAAVALRRGRAAGCSGDPVDPAKLADSENIDGPDCGNVKEIVPKWQKSAKVGKVSGEARTAISGATHSAKVAEEAVAKAETAADQAEGVGGPAATGAAEDARAAATKAKEAGEKSEQAAEDLESELDSMKDAIDGTPWKTDEGAITALKKKREEALKATADAIKAADVAMKEAKDANTEAMSSMDHALKMSKEITDKSEKAVEKASTVGEEAKWAVKEADKMLDAADSVVSELNKKIDEDEGDQAKVFEGLKEGLMAAMDSLTTAKEDLSSDMPKLKDAVKATEDATAPIEEKEEEMAGGSGDPEGAGELAEAFSTLDDKLKVLKEKTMKLSMGTEAVVKKKERVGKAAEKATEFGFDWKPPPETPFGAPGEGRVGDNA